MTAINQIVNVNSFYFKDTSANQRLKTYPKAVEFGNTTISFLDGLQYLIHEGKRIIQLFDMTDGRTIFRLKFEDDQWTLISTKASNQ